jgi:hypothetical protein
MHLGLTKSSSVNKWQELVTLCSEIWIFQSLNLHSPRVIGTSIRTIHFLCICVCALYPVPELHILSINWHVDIVISTFSSKLGEKELFSVTISYLLYWLHCICWVQWGTQLNYQHWSILTWQWGSDEKLHCRQCMTCKDCIHSGCPQQYWEHSVHRKWQQLTLMDMEKKWTKSHF